MSAINEALRRAQRLHELPEVPAGSPFERPLPSRFSFSVAGWLWILVALTALGLAGMYVYRHSRPAAPAADSRAKAAPASPAAAEKPVPTRAAVPTTPPAAPPVSHSAPGLSPEQSGVLEKGAAAGETQIPPAVQGLGEAILQMGTSGRVDEDTPADPDAPGVFPNPPDPALDTPFEEPRRIGPEDGMAQAEAALDHDQAPEAARILAQLVEAQPKRLEARLLLADVHLFHLNSPKEAKAGYEAVLRIEPRNKRALNNLGVLHLEQGRLGEAEKKFSLALEVDKTYVDPLFNLACVAARSQKTSLALSYLDRARRLDPQVAGWAAQDKDLQSLRGQPAFDRLVKESRP